MYISGWHTYIIKANICDVHSEAIEEDTFLDPTFNVINKKQFVA